MKVVAFAASNSTKSINKKLVTYATHFLKNSDVEVLDLNDFELPLFSVDKEEELGKPELAKQFINKLGECDALVISFAEHNGAYSAAYKNLFDWCSRINPKVFQQKPMVLLSTSPGKRGGATVLSLAQNSAPHFAGNVKAAMSLPSFFENFDTDNNEITNEEYKQQLKDAIETLQQ